MLSSKLSAEKFRIFHEILMTEPFWIPCHIHKELSHELSRLYIPNICYPHLIYSRAIGKVHLMPHLLNLHLLKPFHGTRTTIIAKMTIHAISALPRLCLLSRVRNRNLANVAPVIVAKHHDNVFWNLKTIL